MINLLPPKKRSELKATRHNAILVRYVLISIVFFAVTIFIHFGTYLLLRQTEVTNSAQSESHLKKAVEYEGVHQEAIEYSRNLAAAKAMLADSIPYPEALSNLAKTLPQGVIIDNVNLEAGVIDQAGTLTAHAATYDAAIDLKDAFSNSPIAKDVSIASVTDTAAGADTSSSDSSDDATPSAYPIQVTLNITFTRDLLYPSSEITGGPSPERPPRPNIPNTQSSPRSEDAPMTGTADNTRPEVDEELIDDSSTDEGVE